MIDDSLATPPSEPIEGSRYRILDNATDEWQGRDGAIAIHVGGAWEYIAAQEGMSVFDTSARTTYFFTDTWTAAVTPAAPSGGSVIDVEARAVLASLIEALETAGIFERPL
ncbi:DUF2793 domain-containing protein [Erythrobacter sp. SCSIO 43205]|nr:DUF2793 domain-containing protein [Erythrobacter sp. SCSIO 43205]